MEETVEREGNGNGTASFGIVLQPHNDDNVDEVDVVFDETDGRVFDEDGENGEYGDDVDGIAAADDDDDGHEKRR